MESKEFTLESRKETFRLGKITPVELLAITTQVNFEKFEQTEVLFKFAFEHVEVKQGDTWVPVKVKDKEVYMPIGIEEDMIALNEICSYFMTEVIAKTFMKSRESIN